MDVTHKDLTKMLHSGQNSHNLPLKWLSSSSGTFSLITENFPGLPFFSNLPPLWSDIFILIPLHFGSPLSLMILFYNFNMVDTHVGIVIMLLYFFHGFVLLKILANQKMIIITTIRKLVHNNGCYYIHVLPMFC